MQHEIVTAMSAGLSEGATGEPVFTLRHVGREREAREGDIILEGYSSSLKTSEGARHEFIGGVMIPLRESDNKDAGLRAKERALIAKITELKRETAGLKRQAASRASSSREALRESFKAIHPEWTDAQLDMAVRGLRGR